MTYLLSLGCNLGERESTLRKALREIEEHIGSIPCCSSFYYSSPWGFESEHEFCNLCCQVETPLCPVEMLRATQSIEVALGRTEKTTDGHYSDRVIDIDLIIAINEDGQEINEQFFDKHNACILTLPHPLWSQREFVRIPLAEIWHTTQK